MAAISRNFSPIFFMGWFCRGSGAATADSGRQFEAGDSVAEAAGDFVELLDGQAGLTQRLDRLLRGLAQLRERLADLLRAGRLGLHALVHALDPRGQRLDLLDDLGQLPADLLHL